MLYVVCTIDVLGCKLSTVSIKSKQRKINFRISIIIVEKCLKAIDRQSTVNLSQKMTLIDYDIPIKPNAYCQCPHLLLLPQQSSIVALLQSRSVKCRKPNQMLHHNSLSVCLLSACPRTTQLASLNNPIPGQSKWHRVESRRDESSRTSTQKGNKVNNGNGNCINDYQSDYLSKQ